MANKLSTKIQKERLKTAIESGGSSVQKLIQKEGNKVKVQIKPISANEAWKGRRIKTNKYKAYENALMCILPASIELPLPPFQIHYTFGFSSLSSDWDNPIKQTTDILSKKYKFNDKLIKRAIIEVEKVEKGQEFFEFEITHLC